MGTIATTFFAQSLSNFTCKLWMMRGGTLLILGHVVKGQGQLCPPARGCHALRCLVVIDFVFSFFFLSYWFGLNVEDLHRVKLTVFQSHHGLKAADIQSLKS